MQRTVSKFLSKLNEYRLIGSVREVQ